MHPTRENKLMIPYIAMACFTAACLIGCERASTLSNSDQQTVENSRVKVSEARAQVKKVSLSNADARDKPLSSEQVSSIENLQSPSNKESKNAIDFIDEERKQGIPIEFNQKVEKKNGLYKLTYIMKSPRKSYIETCVYNPKDNMTTITVTPGGATKKVDNNGLCADLSNSIVEGIMSNVRESLNHQLEKEASKSSALTSAQRQARSQEITDLIAKWEPKGFSQPQMVNLSKALLEFNMDTLSHSKGLLKNDVMSIEITYKDPSTRSLKTMRKEIPLKELNESVPTDSLVGIFSMNIHSLSPEVWFGFGYNEKVKKEMGSLMMNLLEDLSQYMHKSLQH